MSKDNLPASIELEARFVHLPLGVWGMALMALWLPGLAGRRGHHGPPLPS
jgi:hypothetical protein